MFDYLAFVYGGLSKSSGNALKDGAELARQCLNGLSALDKERFPPRLLILLASPAYLNQQKAELLLRGISETFDQEHGNVELIGSSVAAVFFDRRIHPKGVLLICLASRLIEASVACGINARQNPKGAISSLLKELQLDPSKQIDPNPLANRLILTFMPGCSQVASNGGFYPAPYLHRLLYEGVQARIWLIGGVSSANDPSRKADGFQFTRQQVLQDSVVAASIVTGVPIGVSLNDGLVGTDKILRVTKLGKDRRTILQFDRDSRPAELLLGEGAMNLMLAKLSADDERTVDIPLPLADGSVQLLQPLKYKDYFQVFRPGAQIIKTARNGITQAKKRVYVKRPIASLLFPSRAYNPSHPRGMLAAENALNKIEKHLKDRPCVGGFFDGELGVDEKGRSRLTNGGVGYVIFGDEIRERTPLYKGVSALANYGPKLLAESGLTPASIYETIRNALDIIDQTGFPGAMLSLIVSNLDRKHNKRKRYIIAREAVGLRFTKVKEHTQRSFEGKDLLAVVANDKQARFIPDSRKDRYSNRRATELSGIISQYVLPLKRLDDTVFGTLQVDVGDLRHLSHSAFRKTEKARMLDCFAEVFSASINRMANAVENKIMLDLDKALEDSLSATSVHEGVEKFFKAAGKAFGVEMGYLRLVKPKDALESPPSRMLVLETGFGVCYEAERRSKRRMINANENSPICHAFRSNDPHIVNDVTKDTAWRAMLKSVSDDSELYTLLSQTKSYAAVAFKNERGKPLGALSFGSTEPWFFLKFHRIALEALAERLGFLIQHLRAKIERNFLINVSPKLAKQNLNRAQAILRKVTQVFRRALNAEVASLYLWDQDRERYILRAQSNWVNRKWEHAASYDENARWIGVKAINKEPLYVPDLFRHYKEEEYDCPQGRYAKHMFGKEMSADFTVEAIGLPLRIGPAKADKFGVLTLYRRIEKGQPSGFVSTDIQLLQEGAYNAAGLVNAVLRHRQDMWEKDEEKRRQNVYQAINSGDDNESFAMKVCLGVLKAFHAAEVEFYRIDDPDIDLRHSWIAGYRRSKTGNTEKMEGESGDHRKLIKETVSVERNKRIYRVAERRRQLKPEQHSDPAAVKTERLVEQVCIPLIGDKKYIAALVVRWRLGPQQAFSRAAYHSTPHLQILGRVIGSAYSKRRIKERADRGRQSVHTAGLYVFQHAHKLVNAIENLYGIGLEIKSAQNERAMRTKVEELETTAESYIDKLDWVFDLGELIQDPARKPLSLHKIVQECWREVTGSSRPIDKVELNLDKEIAVIADPKLIKEVFINLMNNAITAMKLKKEKTGERTNLKVSAVVSEDKETVKIIFKDNGTGMTRKQKDDAIRGFRHTGRQFREVEHKGVGVLISLYLLRVQDGSLEYETKRGKGTEAIVTLPNFRIERRKDEMANTD